MTDTLMKIAELIAPLVSTRFVDGDPLADKIESVLRNSGVELHDTALGVEAVDKRTVND